MTYHTRNEERIRAKQLVLDAAPQDYPIDHVLTLIEVSLAPLAIANKAVLQIVKAKADQAAQLVDKEKRLANEAAAAAAKQNLEQFLEKRRHDEGANDEVISMDEKKLVAMFNGRTSSFLDRAMQSLRDETLTIERLNVLLGFAKCKKVRPEDLHEAPPPNSPVPAPAPLLDPLGEPTTTSTNMKRPTGRPRKATA
jgi:hypothetical protein